VPVTGGETRAMRRFWRDESGAVSIEYSLLLAVIAILVVSTIRQIGERVGELLGLVLPGFMGI
jgi:Flp pilus assembly pilin Flp